MGQPFEPVLSHINDLAGGSLIAELAAAAREHDVMITINVTPYDQEAVVAVEANERRDGE